MGELHSGQPYSTVLPAEVTWQIPGSFASLSDQLRRSLPIPSSVGVYGLCATIATAGPADMTAQHGAGSTTRALAQGAGTSEEMGNFLVALHECKEQVIGELRTQAHTVNSRTGSLVEEVFKLNEKLDSIVPNLVSKLLAHRELWNGSRVGSSKSTGVKRKANDPPPAENVPFIADLLDHEITDHLRKWMTAVTLLSFSNEYPQFKDGLPNRLKTEVEDSMHIFEGRSGLSTLFFSCEAYHAWDRYHSRSGKIWSFVIQRTLSSIILDFRKSHFDLPVTPIESRTGRTEPPWLTSFGDKDKQPAVVSDIVWMLQTTDKMAKATRDPAIIRRRKRMRDGGGEGASDPFEYERHYAVSKLKGIVSRYLSYGRAEARKKLLRDVMFIVEKIRSFPSNQAAKDAGFWVNFNEPRAVEELNIPEHTEGTIWNIADSVTKDGTIEELDQKNRELLSELINRFPCLSLTLHIRRTIVNMDPSVDPNSYPTVFDDKAEVFLHNTALAVFSECMRMPDTNCLLRSTPVSLKLVHVLACGLRGFILQSLLRDAEGQAPGPIERCALGLMTCKESGKMDYETTSSIGNGAIAQEGNPSTGSMRSIREEMLCITLTEYKEKLAARLARSATNLEEDRSSQSEMVVQAPNVFELTEDYMAF